MAKRTGTYQYQVRQTDNPLTLAKQFNVQPSALLRSNGLATFTPGQYITVPRDAAMPTVTGSTSRTSGHVWATPAAAKIQAGTGTPAYTPPSEQPRATQTYRDSTMPTLTGGTQNPRSVGGPTAANPNYAAWALQTQTQQKMDLIQGAFTDATYTGQLDLSQMPAFVTIDDMKRNGALDAQTMMNSGFVYNPELRRWENPYRANETTGGGQGNTWLNNPNVRASTQTAMQKGENANRRDRVSWSNASKKRGRMGVQAENEYAAQQAAPAPVAAPVAAPVEQTIMAPNIQTILWRSSGG